MRNGIKRLRILRDMSPEEFWILSKYSLTAEEDVKTCIKSSKTSAARQLFNMILGNVTKILCLS